jgi:hypothetical protein
MKFAAVNYAADKSRFRALLQLLQEGTGRPGASSSDQLRRICHARLST